MHWLTRTHLAKGSRFRTESKARNLFVHARRAFEHRYIRPKGCLIQEHGSQFHSSEGSRLPKMVPWVDEMPWEFRRQNQSESPKLAVSERSELGGRPVRHSVHGRRWRRSRSRIVATSHRCLFFRAAENGAWILCGIGPENEDLPGFITIKPSVQKSPRSSLTSGPVLLCG